ncbi:SDR family oxidoreductase [Nitratireductor luteus]|uniref:SDR family oxidoreductase n=1 Tax=Nitratireductor luteus TaxID=2976980 RepID=UPI00223ED3EC|nr:SDR family oxidoreductase [Nitratireductor luteus]
MNFFENLFSLSGKKALVTGGASGIGHMAATAMVHAGAHVMIVSRRGTECDEAARVLNELDAPGSAEGFAGDVGSESGVVKLAAEVARRTDKLHILFNNAGLSWGERIESFPYHAWARVMNVNVAGLFHLTRELLPLLDKAASDADPARIVNLGSVMGTQPIAEGAYSYSASKAAVHHLTRILAHEFAARNITVNAFAPGPFQSRMTAFATGTEEKAAKVGARVPLSRIGSPDDIAGATLYLCSRAGSYITGAILPIDGGQSAQHGMNLFRD